MANDMQPYRPNSMPALPSSLSTEVIAEALNGRVDQGRLKLAIEDLVRPHFYETPEDRIRDVAVLVRDLAEFSDDVAGWAVREWRLKHDRRPTSATLRQLCMVRRHELSEALKRRSPQEPAPYGDVTITDEEREARARIIASAAKASGFVQNKHGQWELPSDPEAPKRIPHWSETVGEDHPWRDELRRARAANSLVQS